MVGCVCVCTYRGGIGGGNEGGEDGGGGMLQGRHPAVPGGDGAAAKWDPDVHGADPERVPDEVLGGGHPREVRLVQLGPPHKPPPLPPPPLRRLSRQRWRSPRLRREPLLPVRQYLPLPSVRILRRLLLTRSLHHTAPTRKCMRACVCAYLSLYIAADKSMHACMSITWNHNNAI